MGLRTGSRYLTIEQIVIVDPVTGAVTEKPFMDIRPRVTAVSSNDRIIRYDDFAHWAGLSLAYLLDANAWWTIADLSGVVDPFEELVAGAQLRVPTVGRYQFYLMPGEETH